MAYKKKPKAKRHPRERSLFTADGCINRRRVRISLGSRAKSRRLGTKKTSYRPKKGVQRPELSTRPRVLLLEKLQKMRRETGKEVA